MRSKNHAPGSLLFQSPDGWTVCTPEFAATVSPKDFAPNYFGVMRRVLEKQGRWKQTPKPDDPQQTFL